MTNLTISEAREFVRARLDELAVETSDLLTNTIDDQNLDQTVDKLLVDAITYIHLSAPASLMEGPVLTPSDFTANGLSVTSGGVLDIDTAQVISSAKKDILRMISFMCGDSDVKLTQAIYEDSPQARMQNNVFVQGQPDSPVLVQLDDSPNYQPHYKYYTTTMRKGSATNPLNFTYRYFPKPALQVDSSAISVSPTTYHLSAAAGSGSITITTSGSWSISNYSSLPSWLHCAVSNGTTDSTTHQSVLSFSTDRNEATSIRSFTLYITNGTNTATCVITQAAATVSPETGNFLTVSGQSAGILSVSPFSASEYSYLYVRATKDLAVSIALSNSSDFEVIPLTCTGKGSTEYTRIAVRAKSANLTNAPKTGTLTFSASGCTSITVTLSQNVALYVTPETTSVIPAEGGDGSVTYTIIAGAAWSAALSSGSSDISISHPQGAAGTTSSIKFSARANTTGSARSASYTITCGGITKTITASQAAQTASAGITLGDTWLTFPAEGGTKTTTVGTDGKAWDIKNVPSWLTAVKDVINGTLTLTASQRNESGTQGGTIIVYLTETPSVQANLMVTQEGISHSITIRDGESSSYDAPAEGGSKTLTVVSTGNWTVSTDASWIHFGSQTGASGTTALTITIDEGAATIRTATITATIDGTSVSDTFTINQAALARTIRISTSSDAVGSSNKFLALPIDGASILVYYRTTPTSEPVSYTTPAWASAGESGTYVDRNSVEWRYMYFTIKANSGTSRTGRIKLYLRDYTSIYDEVALAQAGSDDYYLSGSLDKYSVDSDGDTLTLDISSNISWTITDASTGLSFSSTSGSGDGTVSVTVASTSTARTLSFTLSNSTYSKSQTISIEQSAPNYYFSVSPTGTRSVSASTTVANHTVSANIPWTASISTGASVTVSGSTIISSFPANTSTSSKKTYTLTITPGAGYGFSAITRTIEQAELEETYSISTSLSSLSFANTGETKTFTLSSSHAWTATCNKSGVTISPNAGIAGSGRSISVTIGSNAGSDWSDGVITFANAGAVTTVSLSQAGGYVAPSISLSPNTQQTVASQGTLKVKVFASVGWGASTVPSGFTVSPSSGTGDLVNGEEVTITAPVYSTSAAQQFVFSTTTGSATASLSVVVAEPESISLSQSTASVGAAGGSGTINITCNTSWAWVATDGVYVASDDQSGSGNKSDIDWWVNINKLTSAQTLYLKFITTGGGTPATAILTITQAAGYFTVATTSLQLTDGSESIHDTVVTSHDSWEISSKPDWVTVSPDHGDATGVGAVATIRISIATNLGTTAREGSIAIRQKNTEIVKYIQVRQGAYVAGGVFNVTSNSGQMQVATTEPDSYTLVDTGGSSSALKLTVEANYAWTIVEKSSYGLTFTPSTGTNGTTEVAVTVPANSAAKMRKLWAKGSTDNGGAFTFIWIFQDGATKHLTLSSSGVESPTSLDFSDGESKTLEIFSKTAWSIAVTYPSGSYEWLTLSKTSGSALVSDTVTISGGPGNKVRKATLTITNSSGDTETISCVALPSVEDDLELSDNVVQSFEV